MPVMSIGKCCAVLGLSCSELSVNLRFITTPLLLMDLSYGWSAVADHPLHCDARRDHGGNWTQWHIGQIEIQVGYVTTMLAFDPV